MIEEYEEVFCDEDEDDEVELVVQGRTIVVSERKLCIHSHYFRQVFNDFDEDGQETIVLKHKQVGGEDLPDERQQEPLSMISFITMTTIVEYVTTGVLKINDLNIRQLLYASELLSMPAVEAQCFAFLKGQLTVRNCVRSFLLASAKKSWRQLALYIKNFIIVNFDQVRKLGSIYKQLSVQQFSDILKSEDLNVKYEEEVVDVIYNWVDVNKDERKQFLPSLLENAQWELIRSETYFEQVLEDLSQLSGSKSCIGQVTRGREYRASSYEDQLLHWRTHARPSRWPRLLAALSYAEKLVECYDLEEEQWLVLTEKPGHVFGSAMCYLKGKLYTIGGVQSKQVDQYDVEADRWKDYFPSLRHCRVAHGAVASGDTIYVTGGSAKANANFGPGLYEMEACRVEEEKPEWRTVGTMAEGRSFLGSAAVGGKVYQIAGCINEDFSTSEVWDPKTGKFEHVAKSLSKRDSQGQAVVGGEIFVVGGYDNISSKYLKTGEKFSPETNKWSRLPSMNMARRSPGTVSYRGRVYAVGGMGVEEDLSSVEVLSPGAAEWRLLEDGMKEVNGWCSACLVDKPLRMMRTERSLTFRQKGSCEVEWEGEESGAATPASAGDSRRNWNWDTAENARTQQSILLFLA